MDERELNSRLSRISTIWSLLARAQSPPEQRSQDALVALIQRYQGAVYRYLLGALRNPDAADELFQEFAVRLTQGAFRAADPRRGRFRDYLKTTLYHLIVDYQNRRRKAFCSLDVATAQPAAEAGAEDGEASFLASWREEMLAKAWAALHDHEVQSGQPWYSVLKLRTEYPEATSAELANLLAQRIQFAQPPSETAVRKTLQRARARFAEALVAEVSRSLTDPTADDLEQELIDVGLLPYCRSALAKRRGSDVDPSAQ